MTSLTDLERQVYKVLEVAGLESRKKGGWATYEELRKAAKGLGLAYRELFPDLLHEYERSVLFDLLDKGYVESADYPTTWSGNKSVYRILGGGD